MMISPETYVKLELEGLSNDEIISKIRGLKREMTRLKREVEYVGLEDEEPVIVCPSPDVRITMQRDYIVAARKFLEEQGGELPLTKAEIRARKFEDDLKYVEKIRVEIRYARRMESINREFTNSDPDWDEMIGLLSYLHIGDWKPYYEPKDVVVFDGVSWSVEFEYTNGIRKRKFAGANKFPYNFDRFIETLGIDRVEKI